MKGALLGLLLERPDHGYQLGHRLGVRVGPAWRIQPRRVYPLLDQLVDAGLAEAVVEPSPGSTRQMRAVYYPTDATAEALQRWMETLAPKEPVRANLQAKIAVSSQADAPRLLAALRQYERECIELLRDNAPAPGAEQSWRSLVVDLTRDAVDVHLRGEVEWARRARVRIKQHAAQRPSDR
ncbi:MAG TPA: PadR family transcriptional regulator [Solirubrobacteraceae bacterium]|nr:PadR family transcriptional regulator [Solirubrobacteraceae bacterium]